MIKKLTGMLGFVLGLGITVNVHAAELYYDGELRQEMDVVNCMSGESCSKKLSIRGSHRIQFNFQDFSTFQTWLANLRIETSVYDANWQQPQESDVTIKINSATVGTEKFERECVSCKKRRRKKPEETANIIWSQIRQGDTLEFVFEPISAPVDSTSFTANIKRWEASNLVGSQSRAWYAGQNDTNPTWGIP